MKSGGSCWLQAVCRLAAERAKLRRGEKKDVERKDERAGWSTKAPHFS